MPTLVLVGHPGLVVEGLHDIRERTVGDEHREHAVVSVVVSVSLRGRFVVELRMRSPVKVEVDLPLCPCRTRHDFSWSEHIRTSG